jgi:Putative peptidoglycan binding domain
MRVSVEEAAGTVGGIVLRFPPAPGEMGHIAICDGRGGTVEAKGTPYGVVADTVQHRYWDTEVKIPRVQYDPPAAFHWIRPSQLYWLGASNMNSTIVTRLQQALAAKGFDPGPIDGEFGANTAAAIAAFQATNGLVVDGQVGTQTASALGVVLA